MDTGTRLLRDEAFTQLCSEPGFHMCYCDLNAKANLISPGEIPPEVKCGSQYNNAVMVNTADRVIVL